ncbi:MAG: GH92 family glycosyl hydrolase, partial [Ignavibacteriae bacterium]|nr:GH92 family glycosyl hydrolase [Ignavibacteriota bacterium]
MNLWIKSILIILSFSLIISCLDDSQFVDYTKYVNPFIGTQKEGHTFPGATVPLGMVQVSPESYNKYYEGYEADHVVGYQYNDPWIIGFTQTHLNGVGCPSMSDILLQPLSSSKVDHSSRYNFKSTFTKDSEEAIPGYYKVYLIDHKVNVELTATEHAAYRRYAYDNPESAKLLIDLQYGVHWDINSVATNILAANQQFEDDFTLSGYRRAREWAKRDLYYVVKFNKKIISKQELSAPENKVEKAPRYILEFDMKTDNKLEVQIGLSTVGIEEAKANLETEINSWNSFDHIRDQANSKWNDILKHIEINADEEKKISFYTSLYRLYIQPNNIADIDGKYRTSQAEVKKSKTGKYYSTLSLWDTYRAANPLYTILTPNLVSEMLTSMLDSYNDMAIDPNNPREANRYLPRWQLWGKETHTMIGNHAVPVFVDAYLKGIKPPDYTDEQIFEAIWSSVNKPHYRNHVELIDSFGYIPYDVQLSVIDDGRETVSRLLEGIYDDYCAGLLANELGKKMEFNFLNNRSGFYINVYDPESGFMRGKNSKGE